MGERLAELDVHAGLIDSTHVAGIRTVFAPREGPLAAGLIFRVGRADESFAESGITHLIEHLALFGRDDGDIHHNGETADEFTHFHVFGSEAEVVAFLNGVCRALSDLPLHRVEAEKAILRTEASGRHAHGADAQRIERYGSVGPATAAYGEVGLHAVDAEKVTEWAARWFTKGNAVLWLTSDHVPDGLVLDLPDGPLKTIPEWSEVPRPRPAYFVGSNGGALIDAVVARSSAAAIFSQLASKMLFRTLRIEGGHSYTAMCEYEPIDGSRARITLVADMLSENHEAVTSGMISVLNDLRAGDIDEREFEATRGYARRMTEVPSLGAQMLPAVAMNLLTGCREQNIDELVREAEMVTVDDITAVAETVWHDALAQIPAGSLEWAGFELAPRWSRFAVAGERFPLYGEPDHALIISPDGVSALIGEGVATVLLEECVGYLMYPDGARVLFGADGFRVFVEPTQYFGLGPEVVAALDERAPARAVIRMPPRPEEEIPPPRGAVMRWRGYGPWAGVLLAVLLLILAVAFPAALAFSAEPSLLAGRANGPLTLMRFWAAVVVLSGLVILLYAGLRRRRRWRAAGGV